MIHTKRVMFGFSRGELVIVVFIFVLVWGAGLLPPLAERFAARLARKRARGDRKGR
jgi:Sec-independent protein translocase protein TatA